MSNAPFLITAFDKTNPKNDLHWVPDGENMWFLPCILGLVNHTYSGYWYGTQRSFEDQHYHTGIAQGTVLHGEMFLDCGNEKLTLKSSDSFLLPPNTVHSADMIPDEKGFLFFGIVVGKAHYINNHETLDVTSYYDLVTKHYSKHGLSLDAVAIN